MVTLRGVFGQQFTYGPQLQEWTWEVRKSRVDPSLQLRELIDWPDGPEWPTSSTGKRLWGFQRAGITWMLIAQSGLLGDETGCGKTPQVAVLLSKLRDKALPALIV